MQGIISWVREYQDVLQLLGVLSLLLFVLTLIIFPLVIVFLPQDYFVRHRRDPAYQNRRHSAVWLFLTVLKNILGAVLILAGISMLVLPGQGLLTILIGVTLINFPGKYALERKIVRRPAIAKTLDKIRRSAGKPQLEMPEDDED